MKKYILPLMLLTNDINALDFRYGQGDFEWNMALLGLPSSSVTLDDTVISIGEQHQNIADTPWYFFANLDMHGSHSLDKATGIADSMRTIFPSLIDESVSSIAPVPSSFEVSGVDIDVGLGYDVIQDARGELGIGIVTGLSTPFMQMSNYIDSYNSMNTLLEDTSTEVDTYKFGFSLQGAYSLGTNLSIYGTSIHAIQTGEMTNELINSSFDVSGSYNAIDIGVKLYLSEFISEKPNAYIKAGYAYKNWKIDEVELSKSGAISLDTMSLFESEMTSDFFYLGLGLKL